jgi:glycosyltransferase involved in cell wall biosynthesis
MNTDLNVLSISSDRKLFEIDSPVRKRQISFGYLADQFHIIVFAKRELGLATEQISKNTWIHPTNSSSKFFYMSDAIRIGLTLGKFGLVTTQDPFESGWTGYKLSKKLKAKLHVQLHTDFLNPFFNESGFLNKMRVSLGIFILRRADGIRVVSSRIKQSLKKLNLKIDPDIIPVFIDIKRFQEAQDALSVDREYPDFKKIILTVARLEEEKNLRLGISAFKDVLKTNQNIGYIIVGDGTIKNDLENFVKQEGLEKNVIFVGWQNNLTTYYKSADVYLSTSNYEGYGVSMIEAVISLLPIVSTDVGVAGDVLVNNINSFICPVGDKGCIVGSLERLLKEKYTAELFKENSKKISNNLIPQFEYSYYENYRKSWLKTLNSS